MRRLNAGLATVSPESRDSEEALARPKPINKTESIATIREADLAYLIGILLGLATTACASPNDVLLGQIRRESKASLSDSLVIVENDNILVSEFSGGGDRIKPVASISKSLAAIAVEILIDQGKIASIDLPMSNWIPHWAKDPQKSKITLRMIMSHTSGMPSVWSPNQPVWAKEPDAVAASAAAKLDSDPGTQFAYSSAGVVLLQTVIAQASGRSVTEFLRQYFFRPIGITGDSWAKDKKGHERLNGGLFVSTGDLVVIGRLLLNRGVFGNQRILSERAAAELARKSQDLFDYGLLFWLEAPNKERSPTPSPADTLTISFAEGYGGQYLVVYPAKRVIAVRTNVANMDHTPGNANYELENYGAFLKEIGSWQ